MNVWLTPYFRSDPLSDFVGLFVIFFSVVIAFYSLGAVKGIKDIAKNIIYVILTAAASLGAVYSNNLVVFISFFRTSRWRPRNTWWLQATRPNTSLTMARKPESWASTMGNSVIAVK